MRHSIVFQQTTMLQKSIYSNLNNFSQRNKNWGRFFSIPVSILDVAIDTLRCPLTAIEHIALAAINLIGVAFSTQYSLKDALVCTEVAVLTAVCTPIKIVFAP